MLNDESSQLNQALNPEPERRLSAFEESQKQQIDTYLANLKTLLTLMTITSSSDQSDDTVPMILQLQEIEAKKGKLRDHNNLLDDIEKYEDIVISLAGSAKLQDKITKSLGTPRKSHPIILPG